MREGAPAGMKSIVTGASGAARRGLLDAGRVPAVFSGDGFALTYLDL